jgi:hypothetical protein
VSLFVPSPEIEDRNAATRVTPQWIFSGGMHEKNHIVLSKMLIIKKYTGCY